MAVKSPKQATQPDLVAQSAAPDIVTNMIAPDIEDMIADQLLDDIDWSKVRSALLKKAPSRLFKWLQAQLLPTDGDRIICTEVEAMALSEGKTDD
jgi:hypothetical protein